jgi:hypothetical protein
MILRAPVADGHDYSLPRQLYAAVRRAQANDKAGHLVLGFEQLLERQLRSGQPEGVSLGGGEVQLSGDELRCVFAAEEEGAELERLIRSSLPGTLAVELSEEVAGLTGTVVDKIGG